MSVVNELSIARKTFDDMTFENDIGTDAYLTGRVGLTLILEHIRNSAKIVLGSNSKPPFLRYLCEHYYC